MDNLIVTGLGLLLTAAVTVAGTTWRMRDMLAKRDTKMVAMITAHELADAERFARVGTAILEATNSLNTNFGDTGSALREHMHGLQLAAERAKTENLEQFIRRDSFFKIIDGIDAHFGRIEAKLDVIVKYRGEELERDRSPQ